MSDTQHDNTSEDIKRIERLEVEDEEQRQHRMHDIFVQLDSRQSQPRQGQDIPRSFDFGDRSTFKVEANSELLSRVQAFLPQLAASNAEIARRAKEDPTSVDIETLSGDGRYIQMDLGLGVFEQRRGATSRSNNSDAEMHDGDTSTTSSSSDSTLRSDPDFSDNSDADSDDSIDIISSTMATLTSRPIRPLPRRKSTRPQIVMLGDGSYPATPMRRDSGSLSSAESQ